MDNYLYLIINLTAISLPFACSFEHRVRYFKKFLSLAPGFLSTIVFFIVWDIFFTKWGIWGFNKNYLMGLEFFALPLEEYLFFLCIPYSSLFIHFCKEKLTPKLKFSNLTTKFFVIGLTSFLLIISIYVSFFTYSQIWLVESIKKIKIGGSSSKEFLKKTIKNKEKLKGFGFYSYFFTILIPKQKFIY